MDVFDEDGAMTDIIYTLPVDNLAAGLSKLYDGQVLCDAELEVDGKVFRAHRLVLAASSPYFEAAYVGTFKEAKEERPLVMREGVDSEGLAIVLKAMYTMEITLNRDNVISVLTTAHFLQMKNVIEYCERFMLNSMEPDNCLQYLKLAEVYCLDNKIVQAAEECLLKNFQKVSQDESFLDLSKEAICKYLDSVQICCKERDILSAALLWLNHDESRKQWSAQILGCVRLAAFKTADLISDVMGIDVIKQNGECQAMVHEALQYSANSYTQPLYKGKLNKARATETIILFEEGTRYQGRYETEDRNNVIHFCTFHDGKWDTWSDTVDVPFAFYSACPVVCNNFMFVHGVDGRFMGNVMLRYDGSNRTWMHLTPIAQQATVGYTAAVVDESIVLVGGLLVEKESTTTVSIQNIMRRTFRYSIKDNEWRMVEMVPFKVAFGAGCAMPNGKQLILTGGYTDMHGQVRKTNKVNVYDADRNIWITKPPLSHARVQHSCIEFEAKIYVTGGGGSPEPDVMDTCEVFCPISEQWTTIKSGMVIKSVQQVVFRNQLLGFIGKKPVLKFVPDKSKWKRSDFNSPCKVTVVAVLKVPKPP